MDTILTAVITGGLSLLGTIITVLATSKHTAIEMQVAQAVTNTKIEELTREVRKHNGFAEKIPVLEEKIKTANHRIDDLEHAN